MDDERICAVGGVFARRGRAPGLRAGSFPGPVGGAVALSALVTLPALPAVLTVPILLLLGRLSSFGRFRADS